MTKGIMGAAGKFPCTPSWMAVAAVRGMDTKVQTSIKAAKRIRYVYFPTLSVIVWTSPLRPMTMSVKIGRKIPDKVKPARPDKKSLPLLSPKCSGKIRLPAPK